MSIITIIISAAIAAGISYLLHILDKDNNSMEKVKRYADKRLAEFNQYFQTERKTLDEASAEIETRQAQASAAIRRFEEQISQFKKMTENLQADSDSVHNIEEKIENYDKVVSELIQMTARVEENLENESYTIISETKKPDIKFKFKLIEFFAENNLFKIAQTK